ncbi:MAG TPA: hypothetical protein VGQ08_12375 [Nitrospiraceae bacterium]|jgi:hypothetical protein|nr:hypothetical protein [Nitrospiraceae bacterium]
MPEVSLCQHCLKPIDKATEGYVVTKKQIKLKASKSDYAHIECQKKHVK